MLKFSHGRTHIAVGDRRYYPVNAGLTRHIAVEDACRYPHITGLDHSGLLSRVAMFIRDLAAWNPRFQVVDISVPVREYSHFFRE